MEELIITAPRVWWWTDKRYKLARLIAGGSTYKEASDEIGLSEGTIKCYMYEVKEFREYVDKITLDNELTTRAGLTRLLLQGIKIKGEDIKDDKDTMLAYLKYLNELGKDDEDTVTELEVTFK